MNIKKNSSKSDLTLNGVTTNENSMPTTSIDSDPTIPKEITITNSIVPTITTDTTVTTTTTTGTPTTTKRKPTPIPPLNDAARKKALPTSKSVLDRSPTTPKKETRSGTTTTPSATSKSPAAAKKK